MIMNIRYDLIDHKNNLFCNFVVNEPTKAEITLSCKVDPFQTKWGIYIWSLENDISIKECIEQITGLKVKRIFNFSSGNGHGGFEVEYENTTWGNICGYCKGYEDQLPVKSCTSCNGIK